MRNAMKLLLFGGGGWSVVTTPAQSLGPELTADGEMEIWLSPTNLTNWTEVIAGTSTVNQETVVVHGGSNAARLNVDGSNSLALISQALACSTGDFIEATVWAKASAGTPLARMDLESVPIAITLSTTYTRYRTLNRAPANNSAQVFFRSQANTILYFDDASDKKLTPNTQLVAPSANMRLAGSYALPGSPDPGTQVWLLPRISAFATGNYLLGHLVYTGSQWNAMLYTVAAHVRTATAAAATNIGATVGMRVNCNGDTLTLETTADGITWTARGTPVTSALYNTATGYNVIATSDVTLGALTAQASV